MAPLCHSEYFDKLSTGSVKHLAFLVILNNDGQERPETRNWGKFGKNAK